MNSINLSIDARLFEDGSAVARRFVEYGKHSGGRIDVIVYTKRGYTTKVLAPNVTVHPTNSSSRFAYFADATALASKCVVRGQTEVTSQDAFTNIVAFGLRKKFGTPVEVQVHTDFLNPLFVKESLKNRFRSYLYSRAVVRADTVRAVSERIKRSLVQLLHLNPTKVSVRPLFIDADELTHTPTTIDLKTRYPQHTFIFLMNSRLEVEKNIPLALRAFLKIHTTYPHAGLVILGDGRLRARLTAIALQLGIADAVHFEGWVNAPASYYRTAQAFVQVSNYEGYGVTLVEAALLGTPIITTDVGIVGDVLKPNLDALVIPVGDEVRLVQAMRALIDDNQLRVELSAHAHNTIESHIPAKEDYFKVQ